MVGPRAVRGSSTSGVRKQLDLQIRVPVESMVEPDHGARGATRSSRSPADEATRALDLAGDLPASCSSWCATHRSTIIFVNNRRAAERLALRLNELAAPTAAAPATDDRARASRLARARGADRRSRSC